VLSTPVAAYKKDAIRGPVTLMFSSALMCPDQSLGAGNALACFSVCFTLMES